MLLYELASLASSHVEYSDRLNPVIFDESSQMLPKIRGTLLQISEAFLEYLEIDDLSVTDIVMPGSNANYNYTKYSDIDLHVVTDMDAFGCSSLADKYFDAKRNLWNNLHEISLKDFTVEVYVEDKDAHNESQGRYSILRDKWIQKPTHNPPKFNDRAVDQKASDLMIEIDSLLHSNASNVDEYTRLKERIWKMRRAALERGGEFTVENLAFQNPP